MSRYDFPVLSLNTLLKIINTTKSGFRIMKSATILKNSSKNVIYWRKIFKGRAC